MNGGSWIQIGGHDRLAHTAPAARERTERSRFRVLVIGEFGGESKDAGALGERRPVRVDRDTLDECFARIAPSVVVPASASGESTSLALSDLDDLEPDAWVETLPLTRDLLDLRRRVGSTSGPVSSAALDEARALLGRRAPEPPRSGEAEGSTGAAPVTESSTGDAGGESLLDQAVRATDVDAGRPDDLLRRLVREVTAPYDTDAPAADEADIRAALDRLIGEALGAVLHRPEVRTLESSWRALRWLVLGLESDRDVEVRMVDARAEELRRDATDAESLETMESYRAWLDPASGGADPFTLLVTTFELGPSAEDATLAFVVASLARSIGALALATCTPGFFGAETAPGLASPDEWTASPRDPAWDALRSHPVSAHLALVAPRILWRVPFGSATRPVEAFPFEELAEGAGLDRLLWGASAFLPALVMANAHATGVSGAASRRATLTGLPYFVHTSPDGEREAVPVTEVALPVFAARRMEESGVTPILIVRNTDGVEIGPIRSFSKSGELAAGLS